jgi:hypothetical protein
MKMKRKWILQEVITNWAMWSFGVSTINGRGWKMDERMIGIGPIHLMYLSSTQMDEVR